MSIEVHIDWQGQTHLVGFLFPAERGTTVSFEYSAEWLRQDGSFAIDPTSLPLRRGMHHSAALFGAVADCGPDRWGRLVFSLLASNYDDHLRNHGFLMHEPGRWSLSPAYDVNPVPEVDRARVNKTPITEEGEDPGIAVALAEAPRFGLKAKDAKSILAEVFTAIAAWRKTGTRLRIKAATLDAYASAFENPHMDEAARLLGRG